MADLVVPKISLDVGELLRMLLDVGNTILALLTGVGELDSSLLDKVLRLSNQQRFLVACCQLMGKPLNFAILWSPPEELNGVEHEFAGPEGGLPAPASKKLKIGVEKSTGRKR